MPLQATSGAASYDAFGGGVAAVPQYIEDVFSTYLYTGNATVRSIDNGIDLSTKGGLVWIKNRTFAGAEHQLFDTARGATKRIKSDLTDAEVTTAGTLTSFDTTGFSLGTQSSVNFNTYPHVSWTFRKQPKFFDVLTYTGDSVFDRVISHNLGAVPAVIIIKCTSSATDWVVRTTVIDGSMDLLYLNLTNAKTDSSVSNTWSSSTFTVGASAADNQTGQTYVAYLFASNAGGFGLTGTDNVISCGSFTTNGSGTATVSLGYEPQMLIVKRTDTAEDWYMVDNMRGWFASPSVDTATLKPNSSGAEFTWGAVFAPSATGFTYNYNPSSTYIYIAIRRGPMKVPTSGTSVYKANTYTGNATANTTIAGNFGFPVDLLLLSSRSANSLGWASYGQIFLDRLRGSDVTLSTGSAGGETGGWSTYQSFAVQNSIGWGLYGADSGTNYFNNSGGTWVAQGFARAPNFFDEVCYSGTGSATTQAHNLGVVPELMIIKQRTGSQAWPVYVSSLGATNAVFLSTTAAVASSSSFNNTAPTASVFSVGSGPQTNGSGSTYVAWHFATLAGVSKVGSYTGTGTTLQIDCGFTGGARFVLIKRTDSTGDWYVWDSARGIIAGNDPYLLLNTTAAEVTSTDYIDTYSAGFEISSTAPAAINASAGTFVFLAVA